MTNTPDNLLTAALACREAGLCVLPAIAAEKRPALTSWKEYRRHLPTEQQVRTWFAGAEGMCIVAGAVSGNLEMLDFDGAGILYSPWAELVQSEAPGLLDRLIVERSPSGGCHVVYRCEATIPGNQKLAQRVVDGKPATLIETRGEGGLFLCDPTPGYNLQQGFFTALPVLSAAERDTLIEAARALNEVSTEPAPAPAPTDASGRPGDDFSHRGDVRALLQKHGWTLVKPGENEYWRRPGKPRGWSATLKGRVFFCFTSGAPPFEEDKAYSPFSVWGRVSEQVRKLALLYAISEDRTAPRIGQPAVEWASRFVIHQTRRMLFMAAMHVAENPFHAECLKVLQKLREATEQRIARRDLMRAMRCKATDFEQLIGTLLQQGDIEPVEFRMRSRVVQGYRLA